ncbi:MAG: lipid A deacylase LpxR family protein [Verrucomicrobiia bacterium]
MDPALASTVHVTSAGLGTRMRLDAQSFRGFLAAALALCFTPSVEAAGPSATLFDQGPVLAVTEENDFVNRTDRWYSQGAKIAFYQAANDVPRWTARTLDKLPALGFEPGASRIGYEIGQSIFTPADTDASELQLDDRPYAGWLYGGLILQRRGSTAGGLLALENVGLQLGIIGPASFADNVQTWYHGEGPKGWRHQLKNELGLALKYGRAWLVPVPSLESRHVDLIPHAGLSGGNVDTSLRAGVVLRAGWNLPADFGPQLIESVVAAPSGRSRSADRPWGFYFFTGAEGRAVLYTAFLDGNIFRDSHSVDKEPFVGEVRGGMALVFSRVELAYGHLLRTREFEGQPHNHTYGSLSLSMKF